MCSGSRRRCGRPRLPRTGKRVAPNNQVSYQLLSQHGNIKSWCPQVEGKRTSASTYHLLSHFMMASPPISRCGCMYRLQPSVYRSVMCRSCREVLQYRTVGTIRKRQSPDIAQTALAVLGMIQLRCCHITRIPFHGPHRRPQGNCRAESPKTPRSSTRALPCRL